MKTKELIQTGLAIVALVAVTGILTSSAFGKMADLADTRLTGEDVPAGWTVEAIPEASTLHQAVMTNMRRLQEKQKGFDFEGQRISSETFDVHVYRFVYDSNRDRRWIEGTLDVNKKNWKWRRFTAGDTVVLAVTEKDEVISKLVEVYGRKVASTLLDKARALLEAGNEDQADSLIQSLLSKVPGSLSVCSEAGSIYLHDFSSPRGVRAEALFTKVLEAGEDKGLAAFDLWTAANGRGEARELLGRTEEARADYRTALTLADRVGHLLKARTWANLARLGAGSGQAAQAREALHRAFKLEALFGSRTVLDAVNNDKAFESLRLSDGVLELLKKHTAVKMPKALVAPGTSKVNMSRIQVLVTPPVVMEGSMRSAKFDAAVEKSFKSKFSRRGKVFGKKQVYLKRAGLGTVSADVLEHVQRCILGQGSFDLSLYQGNRHDVPGMIESVVRKGQNAGVIDRLPDYVLLATVDIAVEGTKLRVSVKAALFNVGSSVVTAFVNTDFLCTKSALKGKLKRVGPDVVKHMDGALRAAR